MGFLYYCFTRSENFLVFSVNLRNCILTLHFSWISEPTKFWKNTLVIYLDFVFVVNLLIHNLILYSVFKVHLASHLLWLVVENKGFEPLTPCVQGRCSPSWANSPYACLFTNLLRYCSFSAVLTYISMLRSSKLACLVSSQKSCAFCLSFARFTVLLLVRLSVTYLSMRPPHSLARLVNHAKSCAFFAHAFLKIHSAET